MCHLLSSKVVSVLSYCYCGRSYIRKLRGIRKTKHLEDVVVGAVVTCQVLKVVAALYFQLLCAVASVTLHAVCVLLMPHTFLR